MWDSYSPFTRLLVPNLRLAKEWITVALLRSSRDRYFSILWWPSSQAIEPISGLASQRLLCYHTWGFLIHDCVNVAMTLQSYVFHYSIGVALFIGVLLPYGGRPLDKDMKQLYIHVLEGVRVKSVSFVKLLQSSRSLDIALFFHEYHRMVSYWTNVKASLRPPTTLLCSHAQVWCFHSRSTAFFGLDVALSLMVIELQLVSHSAVFWTSQCKLMAIESVQKSSSR